MLSSTEFCICIIHVWSTVNSTKVRITFSLIRMYDSLTVGVTDKFSHPKPCLYYRAKDEITDTVFIFLKFYNLLQKEPVKNYSQALFLASFFIILLYKGSEYSLNHKNICIYCKIIKL